jgi:uncharacterized membrane protein/thiol-disulfide isomerase/thioredoxin
MIPFMKILRFSILFVGWLALSAGGPVKGQEPEPVVHALLFYHPGCPHCHQLITEHLMPLQERFGDQLVILGMDTSQQWANNLYYEAIRFYELPEEDWVVPILIVGDEVMVGGNTIPARLPGIIENGLVSGGIDLPDFPALLSFLREQDALDPRYPDRRIARRSAPAEDEASTAEDSSEVVRGQDSLPQGEGGGAAQVPSPGEGSAQQEDLPGLGETTAPVDTLAPEDTVFAVDTVAFTDTVSAVDTVVPMDTVSAGDAAASMDTVAAMVEEQASGDNRVGTDSVNAAAPEPGPGGVGTMDLDQAARDLESWSMWDRFHQDRVGNALSVLVLLALLMVLVLRGYPPRVEPRSGHGWIVPVLVLVGTGVAAYLSLIEVTTAEAVCGPVGDCNTVNQSEYAFLFGVLPVGVLGLVGYAVVLGLWLARMKGEGRLHRAATLLLWGAALVGTLFSAYLTFLEPFVIGATCIWCLTSAVVMTLILWNTAPMAARVWSGPEVPGATE